MSVAIVKEKIHKADLVVYLPANDPINGVDN